MRRLSNALGILLLAASLAAPAARAADKTLEAAPAEPSPAEPSPWLFGDWNGERTRLKDRGIDFQFGFTGEAAYNATGGIKQDAAWADQYVAGVTLDLEKLVGIPAAQFQATFTQRTGRNLVDDAELGTLQLVQEVYGRGQTARLTQFWYKQQFADGLIDWKVGRMGVGEDFAAFSCDFQNLTFCGSDPGNIVGDYIYNWPISQWATRLKFKLENFGYVQAGVYDVNEKYLGVSKALLPVWFSGSTGALIPVELGWLPTFGGGLEGSYKIGAWYDTSEADDVVDDANGDPFDVSGLPPARHRGRYGAYINFQQNLTPDLKVFLNAVMADDRTSTTDRQMAAGLVYTGLFDTRPQDDIGFAVGTTHVNDRVADEEGIEGSEYAAEIYYTWRPTPALQFRPNLQYVYRPGGNDENSNVFVLGLKTSANF
jgi:porin